MPSIAITQPYEAVYIVDPDLGDEQITAISTKYRQIIENGGGTVEKTDVWERRRLAYEIKGRTEGIYIVMLFNGKPNVEAELRRIFQISEDQFRFLIVRREETDASTLPQAAEAAPVAAEPAPTTVEETAPAAEPTETVPEAAEPAAETTEPAPEAAAV